MYGIMATKKTTVYIPEALKRNIELIAEREGVSEADVIRTAVADAIARRWVPEPTLPLVDYALGAPDIAERTDELLDGGFGR